MMEVIDLTADFETGFVQMTIQGSKQVEPVIVQCMLATHNGDFIHMIDSRDCGHNTGVCKEVNKEAFSLYGEEACMQKLYETLPRKKVLTGSVYNHLVLIEKKTHWAAGLSVDEEQYS